MRTNTAIALALIAAAGSVAPAGIFSWTGGAGSWNDHTKWNGPAGQVPSLTVDSATLSGGAAEATMGSNVSLGLLSVLDGASVYSSGYSVFVAGDVNLVGGGGSLSVTQTPALRDLDADTITVDNAFLAMFDGVAQADESLTIQNLGAVLGTGVIEMNGSDDLDLIQGALWAWGSVNSPDNTLTIRRTGSSTAELDWSSPSGTLLAWDGATLDVQIPVSGALGGEIGVSIDSTVRVADPVIAGATSLLDFYGGEWLDNEPAVLEAPVVDSYGRIEVGGEGVIDAPFVALRGTAEFGEDCYFYLDSTAVILDSFVVTSPNGTGGNTHFNGVQTLSITGGTTFYSTGQFGCFDLDGSGDMTVNIADGSALVLDTHHIQAYQVDDFSGTLNVAGSFYLQTYAGGETWQNWGEINLDQGEITGRTLENEGLISGSGSVDAEIINTGEIVADGGTLVIDHIRNGQIDGVVRAQTGDLILGNGGLYLEHRLNGVMVIGDGAAIPEVVETNKSFRVARGGQSDGSLNMNAGFLRADSVIIESSFINAGVSTIRASGNDPWDQGVVFGDGGASQIEGVVEVDGQARVLAGHAFAGAGLINAVSTGRAFDLADGADLGGVSFRSAGTVTIDDSASGIGQATVGAFGLEPTSALRIDVGGPNAGTEHDAIAATGAATIDGTLVLGTVNGYVPPMGQTITILSAASVSGSFDAFDDSALAPTRRAVVTVEADRVRVLYTCIADLNSDGLLDLSDVTAFVSAFTIADPVADIAMPYGLLDLGDVSAFANIFSTGCN